MMKRGAKSTKLFLLTWVLDQAPNSDFIPSPFAGDVENASLFFPPSLRMALPQPEFSHPLDFSDAFSYGQSCRSKCPWRDLPGHWVRAAAVTRCRQRPEMLRWLHLASFCVLHKYAENSARGGMAGGEEGGGDR